MSLLKPAACLWLALISGAVAAEWQLMGSNGPEFNVYADPDTKRRSADIVTMTELVNYGDPRTIASGSESYLSEKSQVEYDCSGRRARVILSEKFSGERANGRIVNRQNGSSDGWMPIPSRTNMEKLWNLACERS